MIKRDIKNELQVLLREYPVVVILGPRQAGKTTLAKSLSQYHYCNLESPEERQFASEDPKTFLAQFENKVIFDEIQRVPSLLSYIQIIVDKKNQNGQFVLTGSHQLALSEEITQSLAGRAGIINLLPFSIKELEKAKIQYESFYDYIYRGFLPRVYDQKQRPPQAYSNYYRTYVERDVRQLINLKNQSVFEKFMRLLAGRVGQVLNHNSLAKDVGVDLKTIKHWLSILEASFIIHKLPPYFENFGKRVIKSPKYYFTEVGLLTFLLDIQSAKLIARDPLVGNLFENLVIMDCLKTLNNLGKYGPLYFYRDSNGNEIDLLYKQGQELHCFEIKSSSTYSSSDLKSIKTLQQTQPNIKRIFLIYSGASRTISGDTKLIHFKKAGRLFN